jgi:hypothetical protein
MGKLRNAHKILVVRKPDGKRPPGVPSVDGKIILKWILNKLGV